MSAFTRTPNEGSTARRRGERAPRRLLLFLALVLSLSHGVLAAQQFSLSEPLTVRWNYPTADTLGLTPAASGGLVYLPLVRGDLITLQASDGELVWKNEIGGEFSAAPFADERGVYLASETIQAASPQEPRATGALRALGSLSGVTLWMRTLPRPIRGALAGDGEILYGGSDDGNVYAVRKASGEIAWVARLGVPFSSQPVASGGRVYVGGEDGSLFALEQKTGRTLWRYRTRGRIRAPIAPGPSLVYFGSADSYVYALDAGTGTLRWRSRTGAEVQAVVFTQRGLIATSLDNFVYFLSLKRGERLWKRQLPGRSAAQPLAATDSALFVPLTGDSCVVLSLQDGKQLNSLPVGDDNNTAASPLVVRQMLLVTTRQGLLAFSSPKLTVKTDEGAP